MKKIYRFLSTIAFVLFLSVPVQASEDSLPQITSGYTESGIYYEVHGETSLQPRSDSVYVTRQVTYEGKVIPEKQIFWQESVNGVIYTGTLTRIQTIYGDNKTIVIYRGTLTVKK